MPFGTELGSGRRAQSASDLFSPWPDGCKQAYLPGRAYLSCSPSSSSPPPPSVRLLMMDPSGQRRFGRSRELAGRQNCRAIDLKLTFRRPSFGFLRRASGRPARRTPLGSPAPSAFCAEPTQPRAVRATWMWPSRQGAPPTEVICGNKSSGSIVSLNVRFEIENGLAKHELDSRRFDLSI